MSVLSPRTDAGVMRETATRPDKNRIIQLEAIWQRHARQVYTLALRLLADGNAAEAVTAAVFQHFHQSTPELASDERSLLIGLTIDRSLAWLRKQQRLPAPNNSANPQWVLTPSAAQQPAFPDAVELEKHLLQLPDYLRVVFVFRDGMGLSYAEIAAYLRTDEAQVRQVVHRARLALRQALHERKQDA